MTERAFQELKMQAPCSSEGTVPPTSPVGIVAGAGSTPTPLLPIYSRKGNDNPEAGSEFDVETHISDSSELPSSASAVAARQLESSGSSSIMSEIKRLQQENLALRSENAVLKRSPPAADCNPLTYSNVPTCGQKLRCGAPLRYLVVNSPVGMPTGNFEFSFDSADAADLRRCRTE